MPRDDRDWTLEDVLEAIDDFGSASFGLVAWELLASEDTIAPMWQRAISQRMLRATGAMDLGEPTYRLTLVGRTRLREVRARSTPSASVRTPTVRATRGADSPTTSTKDRGKPRPVG